MWLSDRVQLQNGTVRVGEERCENSLYLVLNKWLLHVLIITCKCLAKAVQIQQTCVVISAAAGKALTSDSDINLIT